MSIRKRMVLPVAFAAAALVMMAVASTAGATHIRPKGATPLRVPLVPAFAQCTTPAGELHGPPLAFPSCLPVTPISTAVAIGTPDNAGQAGSAANSEGNVLLSVLVGAPGPPDDSDVIITSSITDVRCLPGTVSCGAANTFGGADYTGGMQGNATIRISDHWNAAVAGGGTDTATMVDIPYPIASACAGTASATVGGTCTAATSANAAVPGAVKDGKRAVVQVGAITITDGGPDGVVGTTPNTTFEVQGIYIP